MDNGYPQVKFNAVGAGIISLFFTYYFNQMVKGRGERLRATLYEENSTLAETTAACIFPSLTPDEACLFNTSGKLNLDDIKKMAGTKSAAPFIQFVRECEKNPITYQNRSKVLMEVGKRSMQLWKKFYDEADDELKLILRECNFNPCDEPSSEPARLYQGYRIDLIYDRSNAQEVAEKMQANYKVLGYHYCKILSPKEVLEKDPYLMDFCERYAERGDEGTLQWKNNAVALWRPGGCIDTGIFIPKFISYLKKTMGTYTNAAGKEKDCFKIKFGKKVSGVEIDDNTNTMTGLKFLNQVGTKRNKHPYKKSYYGFFPGGKVGTLTKLGFIEPPYAGFAGTSLALTIPLTSAELIERYHHFNHYMEVHGEGVTLAWQARFLNNTIRIGVAGTKAYYGEIQPHKGEVFARNRNLLQLNMINDVLPQFISLALDRDTKGKQLTQQDLKILVKKKIAVRWVGMRAIYGDGFFTVGLPFNKTGKISNAIVSTGYGFGGVSLAPVAANIAFASLAPEKEQTELQKAALKYADPMRASYAINEII